MGVTPSEVVSVTINLEDAGEVLPTFSELLIAGFHTVFAGRQKTYSSSKTAATDFPAVPTNAIGLALATFFSQRPNPGSVIVGRLSAQPTKIFTITPVVADNTKYEMNVNGQLVSFTSGSGTTMTLITDGLATAITALSISGLTATGGSSHLLLSGTAWYSVENISNQTSGDGDMSFVETTANTIGSGTIQTELDAIAADGSTFFGVVVVDHSAAIVEGAAAWELTNGLMGIHSIQDDTVGTNATTDVASTLQTNTNENVMVLWHHQPHTFPEVAMFCQMFTQTPGKRKAYFKALGGIASSNAYVTATMIQNFKAKNVTWYDTLYGVNRTFGGKVASGEWFDVIYGALYYAVQFQAAVWAVGANDPDGLDFDNAGILKMVGAVQQVVEEAITPGKFLKLDLTRWPTQGYEIDYPDESDVSDADLEARNLEGVTVNAAIGGGIYKTTIAVNLVP